MRTTLNVDDAVLAELRELQRTEGKSLGQLASELLAQALARRAQPVEPPPFEWVARSMRPRIDLLDKEQLAAVLDSEDYAS